MGTTPTDQSFSFKTGSTYKYSSATTNAVEELARDEGSAMTKLPILSHRQMLAVPVGKKSAEGKRVNYVVLSETCYNALKDRRVKGGRGTCTTTFRRVLINLLRDFALTEKRFIKEGYPIGHSAEFSEAQKEFKITGECRIKGTRPNELVFNIDQTSPLMIGDKSELSLILSLEASETRSTPDTGAKTTLVSAQGAPVRTRNIAASSPESSISKGAPKSNKRNYFLLGLIAILLTVLGGFGLKKLLRRA